MKIFKSLKEENQWMSISDLMSVLMMIFLFISIVYIRSVNLEKNKITSIARTYETTQVEITNDLKKEFTKNLQICFVQSIHRIKFFTRGFFNILSVYIFFIKIQK